MGIKNVFKKLFKTKSRKSHKLNVYSNLRNARKAKKDTAARKYAQYLASLPKNPIKRFFCKLKPKNFFRFWLSKRGGLMFLKIVGIGFLACCLIAGGLFAYFRKDLDSIRPGELSKNVQSTVTTYLDRNGEVLWVDEGEGNYKLVVDSEDISQYLKDATVAIEDKDFYKHAGVSISGIFRAAINNAFGGSTQGGSTLTQQLIKQVFFSSESSNRSLSGVPRKIKEMILAIEVERMYNKDQILTLYINESPYGGRRNGAESGARTYFGVSAKDLTLAQAALLAAIPQSPAVYDPYNVEGHEALIARQHTVLDKMVEQGYITEDQAKEAKAYPILDNLVPESDQYADIEAPHFVQMVKSELESELGSTVVGQGGLTVTTTLDLRIQNKLEEAMDDMFNSTTPTWAGFTNGAATVEDSQTGQIVALMGSRDFSYPGYGQDNAATAYIQPGSTVKPLVYAELFEKKDGMNYGSGSILKDENINSLYGAPLYNADHKFNGNITIRSSLATSRNIPAVKAMYISGVKTTIDKIHEMGATSYCTQGDEVNVGLAAAIGGCGLKQVDLVNAYATIARQGVYKDQSTILEVKNGSNEVLMKWSDSAGTQVLDSQSTYIVSDILTDDVARAPLDGRHALGMEIPGVKTATKTGTSDKDGNAKDIWMVSYSPALTMGVWLGNSDATILKNGTSSIPGSIIAKVMAYAHTDVYAADGKWTSGDWFTKPSGVQTVNSELYPSWWSKTQSQSTEKMTFDIVSKKKATDYTPEAAKIEVEVTKTIDPITKKAVYTAEGYDTTSDDDVHTASDVKPTVSVSIVPGDSDNTYKITATATAGTSSITQVKILVNGSAVSTLNGAGSYTYTVAKGDAEKIVTATVMDAEYYTNESTTSATVPAYKTTSD